MGGRAARALTLGGLKGFDIGHLQVVETFFKHLSLVGCQIAAGLLEMRLETDADTLKYRGDCFTSTCRNATSYVESSVKSLPKK